MFHTFGYPEPEIFGFFYVHPNRVASVGIFVPSWFQNPARTSYRYLQHYMRHPYLWRYLEGGRLRSWGAKSLQEAGKRGEPFLAGDGYARIGDCSGSTNVLTGSGVGEAWTSGIELAEAVKELRAELGLPRLGTWQAVFGQQAVCRWPPSTVSARQLSRARRTGAMAWRLSATGGRNARRAGARPRTWRTS